MSKTLITQAIPNCELCELFSVVAVTSSHWAMHEALRRARWKPHRLEEIGEVCLFLTEKLLTNGEIWTIYFMVLDMLKHSTKEGRGRNFSSRYGYFNQKHVEAPSIPHVPVGSASPSIIHNLSSSVLSLSFPFPCLLCISSISTPVTTRFSLALNTSLDDRWMSGTTSKLIVVIFSRTLCGRLVLAHQKTWS